jgi:hypothetical protein
MKFMIVRTDGGVSVGDAVDDDTMAFMVEAWKGVHPGEYVSHERIAENAIPTDRAFRNAWKAGSGRVEHDIPKCKAIAHERRRAMREVEFKPHDDVIAKQIPGKSADAAEAARQAIRDKYDAMQAAIDAAESVEQIKAALA